MGRNDDDPRRRWGSTHRGEIIEPGVTMRSWSWESGRRRSGVPWIGVFLVLFGAALLAQELVPGIAVAGSAVVLAIGLSFLVNWITDRGTLSLYVGAFLTALGLHDFLEGLGAISGSGWTPIFLGLALLAIALVRWGRHGGFGWQLVLGVLLFLAGGAQVADRALPGFGNAERLFWPVVLLALGTYLVFRDRARSVRRG